MWNNEITLIANKITGKDKLKQNITEEVKTKLLCRKRSITRSEFYQANQAGLRPSLVVDIHSFEYENQELAEFDGKRYRIIKTYPIDLEILELTLMEKLP
jgi:SPP1 family predicted phage head-tail adaptor